MIFRRDESAEPIYVDGELADLSWVWEILGVGKVWRGEGVCGMRETENVFEGWDDLTR